VADVEQLMELFWKAALTVGGLPPLALFSFGRFIENG
jgi:hypothetical protein